MYFNEKQSKVITKWGVWDVFSMFMRKHPMSVHLEFKVKLYTKLFIVALDHKIEKSENMVIIGVKHRWFCLSEF